VYRKGSSNVTLLWNPRVDLLQVITVTRNVFNRRVRRILLSRIFRAMIAMPPVPTVMFSFVRSVPLLVPDRRNTGNGSQMAACFSFISQIERGSEVEGRGVNISTKVFAALTRLLAGG